MVIKKFEKTEFLQMFEVKTIIDRNNLNSVTTFNLNF